MKPGIDLSPEGLDPQAPGECELSAAELPDAVIEKGRYVARFAHSSEDVDAVLRLRFEVFNLELGEGLATSFETGRDHDRFDSACHHLMVEDRSTGEVVGTYRLQPAARASEREGLYSATVFDFADMPQSVTEQAVELGRACIANGHRNTIVLFLLWKGLAHYVAANRLRFLFGCCSLTSQNPHEGWGTMQWLAAHDHLHPEIRLAPMPGYACPASDAPVPLEEIQIPRLFRTYLRHGATVCSGPAIDRGFKTIDFLALLDVAILSERQVRIFFG